MEENTSKEKLLNYVSIIFLVIGIIGGIICLCSCYPEVGEYYTRHKFNPIMFASGISAIVLSILNYAFLQVIIQISLTLKGLKSLY